MQVNPRAPRKPIVPTLERHELSSHFGDMPDDQWEQLKEDIRLNGLQEKIILLDGKVLDGWHRYRALCAIGRPADKYLLDYDEGIEGPDPKKWVHTKNLFRRQLSAEERVRISAALLGYVNPGRGGKQSERKGPTLQQVADDAKVSLRSAKRALTNPKGHDGTSPPKSPTLPALEKKKAALEKQLREVIAQIEKLTAPVRGRRSR